jgi:hypothetical protein
MGGGGHAWRANFLVRARDAAHKRIKLLLVVLVFLLDTLVLYALRYIFISIYIIK